MANDISAPEIYALMVFLSGFACFIHFAFFFGKPKRIAPEQGLPAWNLHFLHFLIGGITLIGAVMLAQMFTASLAPTEWLTDESPQQIVVFGFAMHLTALLAFFGLYRSYPEKFQEPFSRRKISGKKAFLIALYSFLIVIPILSVVTLAWSTLLEVWQIEPQLQDTVMIFAEIDNLPLLVLMILLTVVLAPISEEVLFRGCLYRFLKAKIMLLPALLVSGALFALLHHNLMSFVPLFLLGVALAYAYERSGDIKVPILMHGIFNLNTVIIILL